MANTPQKVSNKSNGAPIVGASSQAIGFRIVDSVSGVHEILFESMGEEVTVGRSAACDITIGSGDTDLISREHLLFERRGNRVVVFDNYSTNSTRVVTAAGKTRVLYGQELELSDEDTIFLPATGEAQATLAFSYITELP